MIGSVLGTAATYFAKTMAQQMAKNPKVEISAMAEGKWIRIQAEAVLDERIEAQTAMLDAYPNLKAMYQPGDGNTAVYWLKDAVAVISGFGTAPEEIRF